MTTEARGPAPTPDCVRCLHNLTAHDRDTSNGPMCGVPGCKCALFQWPPTDQPEPLPTERIELEGGIYLVREACEHGTWAFLFVHPCDDDPELSPTPGICVGTVPVCAQHGARSVWTIESDEPLTLSPSILCTQHSTHGFVREGKWVSA